MTDPSLPRVRIVVAPSTCLTLEQARELGITLVPLRISVDGHDYRDMIDISPSELYQLLRRRIIPTTAAPSVGGYAGAFQAAAAPGMSVTVGSRISATLAPCRRLSAPFAG